MLTCFVEETHTKRQSHIVEQTLLAQHQLVSKTIHTDNDIYCTQDCSSSPGMAGKRNGTKVKVQSATGLIYDLR